MRHATTVWKSSATPHRTLEAKLPMRLQRANNPRNKEQTAKKRAMMMNANINRVI